MLKEKNIPKERIEIDKKVYIYNIMMMFETGKLFAYSETLLPTLKQCGL